MMNDRQSDEIVWPAVSSRPFANPGAVLVHGLQKVIGLSDHFASADDPMS